MSVNGITESLPYPSKKYAWYVAGVLTLGMLFAYLDRAIITLMVAPIRKDLAISDTEMSLLMGASFTLFYVIAGFPISRLVDHTNRRNIAAVGIIVWSLATVGCAFAGTFWELFAMRMLVGVGEATISPCAYSLIPDYHSPKSRGRALGIFAMGTGLGIAAANFGGGFLLGTVFAGTTVSMPLFGVLAPWRALLIAVGLPGILAGLLMFTVKETTRREVLKSAEDGLAGATVTLREYLKTNSGAYIGFIGAVGLQAFLNFMLTNWAATFFIRIQGVPTSQTGMLLGVLGLPALLAGYTAGYLVDRFTAQGRLAAPLYVSLASCFSALPFFALFLLVRDVALSLALYTVYTFLAGMGPAVGAISIQHTTPNRFRGQVSIIYLTFVSLLGMGLAPTLVALVTDNVFHNDMALG